MVPYIYIGKKVKILYTATDIEIFYRYELNAKHTRSKKKYQYTTNPEHLATKHQFVTEWSPEKFITQASAIHEDVASYIGKILEHKPYPEQAYKSCSGIFSFAHRLGEERLIDACRWADSLGQYSYLIIEEIMRQLRLFRMYDAFKTSLENSIKETLTQDQFISLLINSQWDDRKNRTIERSIRTANFRYKASIEEIDYSIERGLDKNQMH